MKDLTIARIVAATGGVFYGDESLLDKEIVSVSIDSRTVDEGALFVPIIGERFDGHDFIETAMKTALVTLSDRKLDVEPYILVKDTTVAMGDIAHEYLNILGIKVISITGSVGKTSTKETIASVCATQYRTKKTPGNLNNNIGMPRTIFMLEPEDEIAVLEMGINHFGEMDALGKIANPDISVITNIGECQLEFLEDLDGVFRAKTEIFAHLKTCAAVILNGDDVKLRAVKEVNGVKPVFYGMSEGCDVFAKNIVSHGLSGIECDIVCKEEEIHVNIPYPGEHMVMNAMAGFAVGMELGISLENIKAGIENLKLPEGRLNQLESDGITIIDDCYNANPVSIRASLNVVSKAEGRKIAVIGDMGELGDDEELYHRQIGEYAARLPLDEVIIIGKRSAAMYDEFKKTAADKSVRYFENIDEASPFICDLVKSGDTVLVKASHSMEFEKIVKALIK